MIKHFMSNQSQAATVSVTEVKYAPWEPNLKASGSIRAVRGVNVTTELAGMVQDIYFTPGATVQEKTVLAQLKANSDIAQLQSLEANATLAAITYRRDKAQYAAQAISKATLDNDEGNLKSLQAQVAQQTAIVEKKTIRAPFTGRLGISRINPGQYLNAGDTVVTLQQLDPLYIDFFMPQGALRRLTLGQSVKIKVDSFPDKVFSGKITTINPIVESNTRNVEIEATTANPTLELVPGMFVSVEVATGEPGQVLTLPQTAISFNPYGDIVYVVNKPSDKKKNTFTVTQHFVTTGETRGDQIQILEGLKEGDTVVTSGQLKLKNGSQVAINNSVVPSNNPAPTVKNE